MADRTPERARPKEDAGSRYDALLDEIERALGKSKALEFDDVVGERMCDNLEWQARRRAPEVLRARRIELVDDKGFVRMVLAGEDHNGDAAQAPTIELLDDEGVRAWLSIGDGGPELAFTAGGNVVLDLGHLDDSANGPGPYIRAGIDHLVADVVTRLDGMERDNDQLRRVLGAIGHLLADRGLLSDEQSPASTVAS